MQQPLHHDRQAQRHARGQTRPPDRSGRPGQLLPAFVGNDAIDDRGAQPRQLLHRFALVRLDLLGTLARRGGFFGFGFAGCHGTGFLARRRAEHRPT